MILNFRIEEKEIILKPKSLLILSYGDLTGGVY